MSLIQQLESGYKSGEFNSAPFYIGAVWKAKLTFNTVDIVGITHEVYVVADEYADERLFDCDISDPEVVGSETILKITGPMSGTSKLKGCIEVMVKHIITETSTGEKYPYFQRLVAVRSGVVDS